MQALDAVPTAGASNDIVEHVHEPLFSSADVHNNYRPPKDQYYDHEEEEADRKDEERAKAIAQRSSYVKRVIAHPNFRNVSFKEAEKILDGMDQGDCVIRPSSKGADHLTVTWKICDGVCAHIDVRE